MPTPTSSPLKNKKQRSLSPVSAAYILVSVGLFTGAWSTCHVPTHPTHFPSSSSHQLPIAHQLWILHYESLCFVHAGMLMGLALFVKATNLSCSEVMSAVAMLCQKTAFHSTAVPVSPPLTLKFFLSLFRNDVYLQGFRNKAEV